MDFEQITRLNAIRKAYKCKPIDFFGMAPIYILGNEGLWRIAKIDRLPTLFGLLNYEVTCKTYKETRTVTLKQEVLLSKLVLHHEIPSRYPELLI